MTNTAPSSRQARRSGIDSHLRRLAFHLGVVLVLTGVATGCVSRELGPQTNRGTSAVPLAELSGVTLRIGDQKGGTQALLKAAHALDHLPYRIDFSTSPRDRRRSRR